MELPWAEHEQTYPGTHTSASSFISEKPMNSVVMVKPSLGKVHACGTSVEWRIWCKSMPGLRGSTYFYPPLAGGSFHYSKIIWSCPKTCLNRRCPSSYEFLGSPASFQPTWDILSLLQAPRHCKQKQLFLPQNERPKVGSISQC